MGKGSSTGRRRANAVRGGLVLAAWAGIAAAAEDAALYTFTPGPAETPVVEVFPDRAGGIIPKFLFGKFCEHLGSNIYGGMDAQVLLNPTFAAWPFRGAERVDGGHGALDEPGQIEDALRRHARHGKLDPQRVRDSWRAALAFGWLRLGPPGATRFSPDVAFAGNRAQRVEVLAATPEAPAGLTQRTWLPLHRTRRYAWRLSLRAPTPVRLSWEFAAAADAPAAHSVPVSPGADWTDAAGVVDLPADWPDDRPVWVRLAADRPAHWVVREIALTPADAVDGLFDPDVVRLLRESRLPLLRWPGGNFVSGYRWQSGVGPVDRRPTVPNPHWGGVETHRFGTAEFVRFCRAVGCEPMICLNAGDGDPEEAAAWVEYCNGGPDTEGGRRRAAHGDPEPYRVKYWEIGNELWGRWQIHWTTPAGYADRFARFAAAMRRVDPAIEILATGHPRTAPDLDGWDRALLARGGPEVKTLTDHILSSGRVGPLDDPYDVFQGYAGCAGEMGKRYRLLRDLMTERGVADPGVALTEMMIFADWRDAPPADADADADDNDNADAMTRAQMARPTTLAEACHFTSFLCEAARLGGFVKLVTHTATVNHGGGLRKERERVWTQPVHEAMAMLADLQDARRLGLAVTGGVYATKRAYGFIPKLADVPEIDAVAGRTADGRAVAALTNRARETRRVEVRWRDAPPDAAVTVATVAAAAPWAVNNGANPRRVLREHRAETLRNGRITVELPPAGVACLTLPGRP